MFINEWDIASISVVGSMTLLNIVCYIILLFKIKGIEGNNLFVNLSALFLASQTIFLVSIYFASEVKRLSEHSDGATTKNMIINDIIYAILLCLY